MLKVGGAFGAQIDDNVEDGAAGAANELGFRGRRELEMHSANRALADIESDIGLGNNRFEAVRLEFVLTKRTSKKAARIFSAFQVEDKGPLQFRLSKNHTQYRLS